MSDTPMSGRTYNDYGRDRLRHDARPLEYGPADHSVADEMLEELRREAREARQTSERLTGSFDVPDDLHEYVDELYAELKALRRENTELRRIVDDTLWMARRYAHGRRSYAPAVLADAIAAAERLGITLADDRALAPEHREGE